MAYDELLAARIRDLLGVLPGLVEKRMFGGVGFMLHGNMACGVHKDELIVRVGPASDVTALASPHAHAFDMTGRPMAGWIAVEHGGWETEAQLKNWVNQGIDFARSLPAKEK